MKVNKFYHKEMGDAEEEKYEEKNKKKHHSKLGSD
jgi:hypothetical protein